MQLLPNQLRDGIMSVKPQCLPTTSKQSFRHDDEPFREPHRTRSTCTCNRFAAKAFPVGTCPCPPAVRRWRSLPAFASQDSKTLEDPAVELRDVSLAFRGCHLVLSFSTAAARSDRTAQIVVAGGSGIISEGNKRGLQLF